MTAIQIVSDLLRMVGKINWRFFVHIHFAHEYRRNNLLSPIIKWTGPTLYKQQLTADQRFFPINVLKYWNVENYIYVFEID